MKINHATIWKFACLLVAVLFLTHPVSAETIKVPIKVNVAEGAECSDETIKEIVKEANGDLREAGSSVELDLDTANIARNVNVGDPNGHISDGALGGLNTSGQKEADKAFGDGKGIKVYVGGSLAGNPNTYGLAYHEKDKDGNLISPRVVYLKNRPGDSNSSRGNDLAHEAGHTLTLGPGHTIDPNTVADGGAHHPSDPNNMMYPYNPYRDPSDPNKPRDRGNKLTEDQIKEIERTARLLGRARTVTTPDSNDVKSDSAKMKSIAPIEEAVVNTFSKMPIEDPTFPPYVQMGYGQFSLAYPYHFLDINLLFHGLFPVGEPIFHDMFVTLCLDMDDDLSTGMVVEGMPGVDKILRCRLDFLPHFSTKGRVWVTLEQPDGMGWVDLTPGTVSTIVKLVDAAFPEWPETVDFIDGMNISVPMRLLGKTASQIPVRLTTFDPATGSMDFAETVLDMEADRWPRITRLTTLLMPGQEFMLEGENFTPHSPVVVEINGEPVFSMITYPDGRLFASLLLPPALEFGEHEIVVRDLTTTRFDFYGFKLAPNPSDLNADCKVDLLDFVIFASDWLEIRPCCD